MLPTTYTVRVPNDMVPTSMYPPTAANLPPSQTQSVTDIYDVIRLIGEDCGACFTRKDNVTRERFNRYEYYEGPCQGIVDLERHASGEAKVKRISNPNYLIDEQNDEITIYMHDFYGYKVVANRTTKDCYEIATFKCSKRFW